MDAYSKSVRNGVVWILMTLGLILIGASIFLFSDSLGMGIATGVSISLNTLVPSLFPFMVLSSLIAYSRFSHYISAPFSLVVKHLFHLPTYCAAVILMSLIGGYPVGAKLIADLVNNRLLTQKQAERMLCFCVNASPAFVVTGVGAAMFGSVQAGFLLLGAHVAATFVTGILFRPKKSDGFNAEIAPKYMSLSSAFVTAVQASARALVSICAFVTLFAGISAVLRSSGATKVLSQLISGLLFLPMSSGDAIVSGILEVTTGCVKAANLQGVQGLILASLFCSWCSLSIICQIMSIVRGSGIGLKPFLFSRVVHSILSCSFTFLLFLIFPPATTVLTEATIAQLHLSSTPLSSGLLFVTCSVLILFCEKSMASRRQKC